ncbi:MAG: hypothetical protein D6710_02210 [Nitrospirae bacterium]|nr:MAG: hypothetical protein D6710_02210 [Nitrospirota bacterium]
MADDAKEVLVNTLKNSLKEVSSLIEPVSNGLASVSSDLRVEESEEVFRNLSNWLKALQSIYNFANELNRAIEQLGRMGIDIRADYSSIWTDSRGILEEMLAAFESKDWVTLCDLIEYEIVPLLSKGREQFYQLQEELEKLTV